MRAPTSRLRAAAAALVVAVVATACGGDGQEQALDPRTIAEAEGVVSRSLAGTLELDISGDVAGSFQGETPIRILTLVGAATPRPGWLLSVGLDEPVTLATGWRVRPAFDLFGYHGDGTYTVEPPVPGRAASAAGGGRTADAAGQALAGALVSDAFVVVGHGDVPGTMVKNLAQPCTVTVANRGLQGSVDCPEVRGGGGAPVVAFRWTWKADPSRVLDDGSPVEAAAGPGGAAAAPVGGGSHVTATAPGDGQAADTTPPAGAPERPRTPESSGDIPLAVELSAPCVTVGQTLQVSLRTEPGAAVAAAVAFSDAQAHGATTIGNADSGGRYEWQVLIGPDVPPGPADVLVSAGSADGEGAASGRFPFQVEAIRC